MVLSESMCDIVKATLESSQHDNVAHHTMDTCDAQVARQRQEKEERERKQAEEVSCTLCISAPNV